MGTETVTEAVRNMERTKYLAHQMGKNINHIGSHMPSAVVGIIRKRRSKAAGESENLKGGSKVAPLKEYNPYPFNFIPGSM